MDLKEKNAPEKFKIPAGSIALYVASSVVALIAVASLINSIMYFNNTVANYVAQGYPAAKVMKELIPAQLLPGLFEPIAVYGGIAFILLGVGIINHKFSKYLMLLTKDEVCNNAAEKNTLKEDVAEENTEVDELTETVEEMEEVSESVDNSK